MENLKTMDEIILVGHSMGGLVSLMQTVESKDHFWKVVSDQSIDDLEGDPKTIQEIQKTFFFQPNPSIARVITIATPHQGSQVANSALRWLGQKLIRLPEFVTNDLKTIARMNSERINDPSFLTDTTSVDSLSPDNPIFNALANARRRDQLKVHNIIGKVETRSLLPSRSPPASDGVVEVTSANDAKALTNKVIAESHQKVHQHPACILEVSRILLENLAEQDKIQPRPIPELISEAPNQESDPR